MTRRDDQTGSSVRESGRSIAAAGEVHGNAVCSQRCAVVQPVAVDRFGHGRLGQPGYGGELAITSVDAVERPIVRERGVAAVGADGQDDKVDPTASIEHLAMEAITRAEHVEFEWYQGRFPADNTTKIELSVTCRLAFLGNPVGRAAPMPARSSRVASTGW